MKFIENISIDIILKVHSIRHFKYKYDLHL